VTFSPLENLFRPQAIAVIGASTDPGKISGRPVAYLKKYYKGRIYPVNPRAEQVQGLKSYVSVTDIQEPVDLALVLVSAERTLDSLRECADCGIKAAVVFSSGFAEIGPKGVDAQKQISEIANKSGMRILGPNCLGFVAMNADGLGAVPATFTISVETSPLKAGRIGMVSQSGAFGAHAHVLASRRGLGLSAWVGTGNEADLEFSDCLAHLALDDSTAVLMGYMEGCQSGAKLTEALALARSRKKPVVIVKVGRSQVGREASASHTAVLAGGDQAFDAVFRAHGVVRAHSLDEFFDIAYAAEKGKYPKGNRLGIVSISGGVGILMADKAAELGLDVPPLPEKTAAKLKKILPFAATRNPVDVTAHILNDPGLLEQNLNIMLAEGGLDAVAVFLTTVTYTEGLREQFLDCFRNVRRGFPDALIALAMLVPDDVRAELEGLGYLLFDDPTRAIGALASLASFGRAFAGPGPETPAIDSSLVMDRIPCNEFEAAAELARAGIPVTESRLATTATEAAAAATALGLPAAVKIVSPDIGHKSDVGGVALGLETADAAAGAFDDIMARVGAAAPQARIEGVLVSPMAADGVDMILGVNRDPVFGPMVMVGLGGIFAEALKDVSFRLAPIDAAEALAMVGELKGDAVLAGARGRPPCDLPALSRALARLSQFAAANADRIESIDINPLRVFAEGLGVLALDALIVPMDEDAD